MCNRIRKAGGRIHKKSRGHSGVRNKPHPDPAPSGSENDRGNAWIPDGDAQEKRNPKTEMGGGSEHYKTADHFAWFGFISKDTL